MSGAETQSHGVDALIEKLRQDGVTAGQEEAARIRAEAAADAARLLAQAREEADAYLAKAKQSSDRYVRAGKEALHTAMRDAVLNMKSGLMVQFEANVRRLVTNALSDPETLKQMILELAGRAGQAAGTGEGTDVILPAEIIGPDAIAQNPEEIQSGVLTQFVLGLNHEMLEEGVTLHASDEFQSGIRARVAGKDVELDLSDDAIASLLMQHLQPRFRAVMEGVIR